MRLIDSFVPLVSYVVLLRKNAGTAQPSFPQVKADLQRLLGQSEACTKKGECDPADFDQARFIVCAWVDEVLLGSDWQERGQWQREQLQRIYYNTTDAGVEAFERLNQLGFDQREVREVYYVCLSLGFKGRFINQGDEFLLDQLRSSNLKILTGNSQGGSSLNQGELFPEAFPAQAAEIPQAKAGFPVPVLVAALAPVALFGILFLVYYFSLASVANRLF
jgi:type VI secretion system protein ImpK